MSTPTLILVDIQNDYFPNGAMALEGAEAAAKQAQRLLDAFRAAKLPVIHVQHVALRPGATFFLPDTKGVEIYRDVQPVEGEPVIRKHFPNSFRETPLREHLGAPETTPLVIVGMMSHMCVDSTTRAAADLGYRIRVAEDGCATKTLKFGERSVAARDVHASYMAALHGSFAEVQTVDEIVVTL